MQKSTINAALYRFSFDLENLKKNSTDFVPVFRSARSTNFLYVSSSLLIVLVCAWTLSRLTFHALRCVLFPSGHLRPSGVLGYPCSLQFSSPSTAIGCSSKSQAIGSAKRKYPSSIFPRDYPSHLR